VLEKFLQTVLFGMRLMRQKLHKKGRTKTFFLVLLLLLPLLLLLLPYFITITTTTPTAANISTSSQNFHAKPDELLLIFL